MAIAKSLRRFGGIGFDEAAVRVRQVQAKIVEADLLARDIAVRLAEIRLGVAGTMAQRHEHLAGALHRLGDILAHDRVSAGESFLVPQPVENPMRGVALLLMNAAIIVQNLVDPRHVWTKLLGSRPFSPLIARRDRKLEHL